MAHMANIKDTKEVRGPLRNGWALLHNPPRITPMKETRKYTTKTSSCSRALTSSTRKTARPDTHGSSICTDHYLAFNQGTDLIHGSPSLDTETGDK